MTKISASNWEVGADDAREVLAELMVYYSPRGYKAVKACNLMDAELTIESWLTRKEIGGVSNHDEALELAGELWDHMALSRTIELDVTDEETDDGFQSEMTIKWDDDVLIYTLWIRWSEEA